MNTFRHFLQGQQVGTPQGIDGLEHEISRDHDKRVIFTQFTGTVTFSGRGYQIIRESALCDVLTYEVQQQCGAAYKVVFTASVIVADVEFDVVRCSAEASLTGLDVGPRLLENFNIPISPEADISKNEVSILNVAPIGVRMFTPATGAELPDLRSMYDWGECMEHAIAYVSDGEMSIDNEWYNDIAEENSWAVASGIQIREFGPTQQDRRVTYSLSDLWLEMATRYNLWMVVVGTTVRITSDIYPAQVVLDIAGQQQLSQGYDTDRIYAGVEVGDKDGIRNIDAVLSLPYIEGITFAVERFHTQGNCNNEGLLALTYDWRTCSNVIEKVLDGDDGFDDDTFLIQYTATAAPYPPYEYYYVGGGGIATPGDLLLPGSAPYAYNPDVTNAAVLARFRFHSALVQFTQPFEANFQAANTVGIGGVFFTNNGSPGDVFTTPAPGMQFDRDYAPQGFDPQNVWGNGTPQGTPVSLDNSRFTSPGQGYFIFGFEMQYHASPNAAYPIETLITQQWPSVRARWFFDHYDVTDTLLNTLEVADNYFQVPPGTVARNFTGQMGIVLNADDYVVCRVSIDNFKLVPGPHSIQVQIQTGFLVRTVLVASGGGAIITAGEAPIVRHEFERHLTVDNWTALLADPDHIINITPAGGYARAGYIDKVSRNVIKGSTTFTLIGSQE